MDYTPRAVFLDRDGIINKLVFNPDTGMHESPHEPEDFEPCDNAAEALHLLADNRFILIVVSNQPSWAKGKTTYEKLVKIDRNLLQWCEKENIALTERYYCYHHPEALEEELRQKCDCRKPGTQFLEHAESSFRVDLQKSWFVGDRATDVECGAAAGCRTVIVKSEEPVNIDKVDADFRAEDLLEAARIIIRES